MKAETEQVLATCFRQPARRFTLTGRLQNAIASARRKWLIFGEFWVFLSDLEGRKNVFLPAPPAPQFVLPIRHSQKESHLVRPSPMKTITGTPYPLSKFQVLPPLKPIPLSE